MVVAEAARGGKRAQVDRVQGGNVREVNDQPQRSNLADGADQHLPEFDRVLHADHAVRAHDDAAVGVGSYLLEAKPDGGDPTTWLEPVTDEQYEQANKQ